MKRIIIFIGLILVFTTMVPVFAQEYNGVGVGLKKLGQSTMNFLQVGVVPRASSLGDAYTAVGVGAGSIFFNPAGLAQMDGRVELLLSNTEWVADITYMAGAVALNLDNWGVVGFSVLTVDYGDIIGTSLLSSDTFSTNPKGYIETGMVENVGAFAFGLSYSRWISDRFTMGGTARYVGQQLGQAAGAFGTEQFDATKVVFDFGVNYLTGFKSFRFGMSIRNFATAVKYQEISTQLPLTFAVGGAMDMMDILNPDQSEEHQLLLSVEFTHPNNYTERLNLGIEYTFMNLFAVRGGYNGNNDVLGFNAGFGVTPEISGKKVAINYSYSAIENYFDDINRFSVGFSF